MSRGVQFEKYSLDALSLRSARRIASAEEKLAEIESAEPPYGRSNVLDPLDVLLVELSNVTTECELLSEVHPDSAVRESAEGYIRQASEFRTRLMQHRPLYDALGAFEAPLGKSTLDGLSRRVVSLIRRDMKRVGVELDDAERERVVALRKELVEIEQEFSRNIRDDVRSVEVEPLALEGLPADFVAGHPPEDGKVRISTDYPDYLPFMTYSRNGDARHELLLQFHTRATPANLGILDRMLSVRHEFARVLGYPTWAAYATEDKMVGSTEQARGFIESAYSATLASAETERSELLAAKRRDGLDPTSIGDWELAYYTERVKADVLDFDAREVRPYFEYRAVTGAILGLMSDLFGLSFSAVAEPAWHQSVETFDVAVDGRHMGRISLDMHPRDGKYKHAACFCLEVGVGGRQKPHFVLVCNFPDPSLGPALMDHSDVVTYFHEFGHLVHFILCGAVPWTRLVEVDEWDFIEAPSQFLEEWIYEFDVLRRFARHVDTGKPITEALVNRLRAARDFGRGIFVQRQLFFASVSLAFHDRDPADLDTTRLLHELADRYSPTVLDPRSRFHASFGHLQGYTAAYYTYMWSLVIAKDLRTPFAKGLMDLEQARRYRDLILAPGGTKPAAELIEDFLGRPFGFDAFREWLGPSP